MAIPSASNAIDTRCRVLVVDDHPIVRQGLALLINQENDLVVCGEAEEAEGLLGLIATLRPDIVVLDITLRGPDGIDVLKSLRIDYPDLPVLVLSMHDEALYAERALRAGANGYVMKQEATETVLVALRRIMRGEIHVSPRIANRIAENLSTQVQSKSRAPSVEDLTDRELEVFRLIGAGHGTRRIANLLEVSIKTIESHQAHIKEKLGLGDARALIQRAIEWRLGAGPG
jgi:DNA-binding NarL/FixJ family response regulator